MTDIQGRTAFITGGANGIGLGIARSFARAGAKLALADLDTAALARAKAELQAVAEVETFVLDVRDREAYAATAQAVERALGPVSLLFNNAGVAARAPAEKLTYELWDWCTGINLGGVINGVQTFLPRMIERGDGGHIVNTASGAGLVPTKAGALYSTGKYAVVGLSETLNEELAPAGIGVSVLCPGPVATDVIVRSAQSAASIFPLLSEEEARQEEETHGLLQQGATIDEVGEMVLDVVRKNGLYILTDRLAEDFVMVRARAILDAQPTATAKPNLSASQFIRVSDVASKVS
jgi:NAD(P)-dependent dehydrogenase (short-subunit alcohol dehydrogenase family)